jgi:hypothetical protein
MFGGLQINKINCKDKRKLLRHHWINYGLWTIDHGLKNYSIRFRRPKVSPKKSPLFQVGRWGWRATR